MTSAPPLLEVRDVRASYGQIEVLRGVTLAVGRGEAVGLLGPNGHGKTTLLRVVSGLHRPTRGTVTLDGTDVTRASVRRIVERGLIHVAQGNRLFPDCTVAENLTLGAYPRRARPGREERLERVYGLFPRLHERRDQLCGTLSGGERQMVAIGVGLMGDPVLLLLDEPTLGLAPKVKEELREKIAAVRAEGLVLVLVDGDIDFVLSLTDRWYAVDQGRVVHEGDSDVELGVEQLATMYFGGPA